MPDDQPMTSHVSLRVPNDVVEAFDRIAAALERTRSWVMLRALRQYLDDGEGREIEQDTESIAELDRGESVLDSRPRRLRRVNVARGGNGDHALMFHVRARRETGQQWLRISRRTSRDCWTR